MAHQLMRGVQSSANKLLILRSQGVIYVSSQNFWNRCRIGNREVVGFGMNGEYEYCDRMDFPYPAIRFREFKGDDLKLKEKEKGDWKKLTADEKKALYRISFCRTFAEMQAPTGEWKTLLGTTLVFVTLGVWMMVLMKKFVYGPLPDSCSPEWKRKQMEFYVKLRVDPIDGIGSKWDYEKDQWKE